MLSEKQQMWINEYVFATKKNTQINHLEEWELMNYLNEKAGSLNQSYTTDKRRSGLNWMLKSMQFEVKKK